MKKFIIIISLLVFQSACSTQAPQPDPHGALLSFSDLAAEITVNREAVTAVPVSSRTTEKNLGDSS